MAIILLYSAGLETKGHPHCPQATVQGIARTASTLRHRLILEPLPVLQLENQSLGLHNSPS